MKSLGSFILLLMFLFLADFFSLADYADYADFFSLIFANFMR
ncbi:putative membrane protein [Cloacibacterium normanense]|uniref:Putative membrane protein n=1 Tax=Cloacibacterium normanense TaxID=237258 RepID=A0A1E5UDW8_9FLAO|nr:putative membrane protein [Cloacibacterium normanense]